MLHRIALFSNSATLTLVYLDAGGAPHTFNQNAKGVWAKGTAPGPVAAGVTFQDLHGLSNVLFALDNDGKLWSISQNANGSWSSAGFQALSNSAGISFTDFGITPVQGLGVVVCGAVGAASPYVQFGPLAGPLSQPVQLEQVPGPKIAIATTDQSGVPTAVVLGSTESIEINYTSGAYSTDGITWKVAQVPQEIDYPTIAAIAVGNGGTLQTIIIGDSLESNGGLPNLLWDSSRNGSSWSWYGALPDPSGVSFSQAAAANGNAGNLQVVGIGAADRMPYLIWQDAATGNWSAYNNPNGSGMKLPYNGPPIVDLAMGMGGAGSQGYLQVGYLGNDGNVYLNYQELSGSWYSFGPLPF